MNTCRHCKKQEHQEAPFFTSGVCRPCRTRQVRLARHARNARPSAPPESRATVYNGRESDRLENTWDLGELSAREQTAYFRGLWVGWKRGLDSYTRMGAGDGNVLASFLSGVIARVELPDPVRRELYAAGRDLTPNFVPASSRWHGSMGSFHGEQAPEAG